MLPFEVNPWSWMYGIPFALACFCFYRLPMEHRAKKALRKMVEFETSTWATALTTSYEFCDQKAHRQTQAAVCCVAAALSVLSLFSFLSWLGQMV